MEGVEWMKLSQLDTEQINSNSLHIDEMTTEEILTVINQEDQKVAIASYHKLQKLLTVSMKKCVWVVD